MYIPCVHYRKNPSYQGVEEELKEKELIILNLKHEIAQMRHCSILWLNWAQKIPVHKNKLFNQNKLD